MHLAEIYATQCGAKIDKPYIYTKFFPLPVDRYVTLQPFSKYGSKCYDYWEEVVDLIKPELDRLGLSIVQIGGPNEKPIPGCFHTQGQTSIPQSAYIIQNGQMHIGVDSFGAHIASGFSKKIVCLYSNNHIQTVRPYWTPDEDCVLIEPDRGGNKPKFVADENPKTINWIKPEEIAAGVFKMLGVEGELNHKTLFRGEFYNRKNLEWIPDSLVDPKALNTDTVVARMDLLFNEEVLFNQFNFSRQIIYTDKPINLQKLAQFKDKINQIIYIVGEDDDPAWAMGVLNLGINLYMISWLTEEQLRGKKIGYMDVGLIHRQEVKIPDELAARKSFKYQSGRLLISRGKFYQSIQDWRDDRSLPGARKQFLPIEPNDDFWREVGEFYVIE